MYTINRKGELETYSLPELLRDKLEAVLSRKVYRRLKDVFDLIYISRNFSFSASSLVEELKSVDIDLGNLEVTYLLDEDNINHAFSRFEGFRDGISWEDFSRESVNFILPLYFGLRGNIEYPMRWDNERGVWERVTG